jgi:hypothetical protein
MAPYPVGLMHITGIDTSLVTSLIMYVVACW